MPAHSGRAVLAAARRAARDADAPLLLAVSGGLDSMVLLHAMAAVARPRVAAVATFDHGTGAAATTAAAFVAREAAALGLPVVMGRHDPDDARTGGREASWRLARYAFLRAAARPYGARVVTAHSEDDQLETVIMRVLRGSGARGLAGLYAPSDVVRPLLALRRAALAAFARGQGIRWREDPSNRSLAHLRNRVRHELLPALRSADPRIDASLLALARDAARWRTDVDSFVASHVNARTTGEHDLEVARTELSGYDADSLAVVWPALAGRVGLALDRRGTRRLASFTISDACGWMPLAGGWAVEASRERFALRRFDGGAAPATRLPDRGSLRWGSFRFRAATPREAGRGAGARDWTATFSTASPLLVRGWSAGDRLGPAAGHDRRRVKRYLTEAGVRGLDRQGWPVVVAGDDVVWIPGVRRSDAATERSGRPVRSYVCERIVR